MQCLLSCNISLLVITLGGRQGSYYYFISFKRCISEAQRDKVTCIVNGQPGAGAPAPYSSYLQMHFCSTILRKGVLLFVFPEVLIRLFFLVVYLATPMSAVSGTAWAPQAGLFLVATNLHIIIIKTMFYSTLVDECKPTPMKCTW